MSTATMIGGIRVRRDGGGETLLLVPGSELGAGGQAVVYPVPGRPDRVAKIYRDPAPEQELKLRQMLARRPAGAAPMGAGAGIFAWPLELLRGEDGRLAGLLLPRVEGRLRVFELYNPATRRERAPLFHHGLLHRAARNLAAAFHELHEAGYVVGDVNESNILVGEDGRVVLIDTDSFQVRDPVSGTVYRCPVGRPEFTPPELRECSFAEVDRAPEHDRFGLGVLVFQMLMEGTHPFAGRFRGKGEPPSIQERIAAGLFPYAPRAWGAPDPPRTAPPFQLLDPGVRALLRRCFVGGHQDPAARPDAAEWRDALETAEAALVTCGRNEQHLHAPHLGACPWCERARLLEGRDPFPSPEAVRRGKHRRPPVPARTSRRPVRLAAAHPRFRAAANRAAAGLASLSAPARSALLVAALVLPPFVALVVGIPVLPIVVLGVGLRVAGRRRLPPWTLPQWSAVAVVLALLLMVKGAASPAGSRGAMSPEAGMELPENGPSALSTVELPEISSASFAFPPEALDRRPVLQDTAALLAAVAYLPAPRESGADTPETTLRFVLDAEGEVESETVQLTPDPGTYVLGVFRARLEPVGFRPGEKGGDFVRTEMRVKLRAAGGRMSPDLASANWNPGTGGAAPPEYSPSAGAATGQVGPRLLNAVEVQQLLTQMYPPLLRDSGVTGEVKMRFVVDKKGTVVPSSIETVYASHPAFAEASARLVARMRFSPARVQRRRVPVLVQLPISWTLERS